jgi:hypothetical protein
LRLQHRAYQKAAQMRRRLKAPWLPPREKAFLEYNIREAEAMHDKVVDEIARRVKGVQQ